MSAYRRNWLIGLSLGGLVIAGLVAWQLSIERSLQWEFRPENQRLLTDHHHIAGQWLQTLDGIAVDDMPTLDGDSSAMTAEATLILITPLPDFAPPIESQLRRWVKAGGHLIAPAALSAPSTDPQRLNPYGIQRCFHDCGRSEDEIEAEDEADDEDSEADNDELSGMQLEADERSRMRQIALEENADWQVAGRGSLRSERDDSRIRWLRDQRGQALAASYTMGEGEVTLLASDDFFANDKMLYPGNARMLRRLIGKHHDPHVVYLQQRDFQPDFLSWLYQRAPWFWWLTLLWILAWLAYRLPRRGPVHDDLSSRQSDRMSDHLQATARFDLRHNQAQRVIAAMHEERERRCLQRYPDWLTLGEQYQGARLSKLPAGPSPLDARWLLATQRLNQPQELIRFTRLHRQLMQALG